MPKTNTDIESDDVFDDFSVTHTLFTKIRELKEQQEADDDRINDLEIRINELSQAVNMDFINRPQGSKRDRAIKIYEYLEANTNISCLSTNNVMDILGTEISTISEPAKSARLAMQEMSKIYPDIEYKGGEKGRGTNKSAIRIIR